VDRIHQPEIVPDDDDRALAHERIEKLAWLMDNSIPLGSKFSIGLDPLIGLIPGIGDVVGTLVSTFLIVQAHKAGVAKATLLRMVANVGLDAIVGVIPFFGDLFDFAFKANRRNLELYRESIAGVHDTRRDYVFLGFLLLILAGLLALPIMAIVWLAHYTFPAIY
jgi:hypothetical protein